MVVECPLKARERMKISDIRLVVDEQAAARKGRLGQIRDALVNLPVVDRFATIVTGVRRAGKSTLLNQWAEDFGGRVVSIHFDDLRLATFTTSDFLFLDEVVRERQAEAVILDEIQNVPEWERYVTSALDRGRKVLVTGSNAQMLSRELGTRLTGRHLNLELFPFSYGEFIRYANRSAGFASLKEHLEVGGFPAYVQTRRRELLVELFNDILYRDIVVRYGLRDAASIRMLATYLLGHVGCRLAPSRLKDSIHVSSSGTVLDYFTYLEETYLIQRISQFAPSPKARLSSQKKVYACDTGLVSAIELRDGANLGHKLENLVYLKLRRPEEVVSYYRHETNDTECDFIVERRDGTVEAVQVAWELTAENETREVEGAVQAMARFGLKEAVLVTADQRDLINRDGRLIRVVPAYDYLRDAC